MFSFSQISEVYKREWPWFLAHGALEVVRSFLEPVVGRHLLLSSLFSMQTGIWFPGSVQNGNVKYAVFSSDELQRWLPSDFVGGHRSPFEQRRPKFVATVPWCLGFSIIAKQTSITISAIEVRPTWNWKWRDWKDSPVARYRRAMASLSSGFMLSLMTVSCFRTEGPIASTMYWNCLVFRRKNSW